MLYRILVISILTILFLISLSTVKCFPNDLFSVNSTNFKTKVDYVTYIGYTGKKIKVSWDSVQDKDLKGYELRIYNLERDVYFNQVFLDKSKTEYVYRFTFSGHFIFQVRSVDFAGNHSEWVSSTDKNHATVDGVNKGWWIYSFIEPPKDLILF